MSFSFSTTAGASQSTSKPKLPGNSIHRVKFESCKSEDIQGKKDADKVYKVLKFRYSNEEGYFEHTVFEPTGKDFIRQETEFTNKQGNKEKIPQPSNAETMMLFFKHNIDAFVPAVGAAIDSEKQQLGAATWDELRKLVIAIMTKGVNVESNIKLLKNKDGEPIFPGFFTGLTKEGKAYVKNNFIGPKLQFSTYEATRITNEASARVTPVSESPIITESNEDINLDLNFDVAGL